MNSKLKIIIALGIITGGCIFSYKTFVKGSDEIILNGNVEIQDVNVSFRVTGRVSGILTEEGNVVKKGDKIATLDSDILESQFNLAKANMYEAEVNLKNCKKDLDRNNFLFKNKSVSEKTYDDAVVKYKIAEATRDAAVAKYELAKISLNDTIISSPVDGIILTRDIEVGEMINAGSTAFSIMPDKKTRIKTFANESTLSKIKYNDSVYVSIDSLPNKKFKGHIGFISSEAEFTPKNIETQELRTSLVYRVRVIIDENAPELKQGMPVTISYGK